MTTSTYERLVERGCKCGTERPQDCSLHPAGDNRGLAAFYKAGMPLAFPFRMTCGKCGAGGLCYPNVELDKPDGTDPFGKCRTLICPNCSDAAMEQLLRRQVEDGGRYVLNEGHVFDTRPYPVRYMQALLDSIPADQRAECIAELERVWGATAGGSDFTVDFTTEDDGRISFREGRPPSHALALLFDYGRHMRGESSALEWASQSEEAAA